MKSTNDEHEYTFPPADDDGSWGSRAGAPRDARPRTRLRPPDAVLVPAAALGHTTTAPLRNGRLLRVAERTPRYRRTYPSRVTAKPQPRLHRLALRDRPRPMSARTPGPFDADVSNLSLPNCQKVLDTDATQASGSPGHSEVPLMPTYLAANSTDWLTVQTRSRSSCGTTRWSRTSAMRRAACRGI